MLSPVQTPTIRLGNLFPRHEVYAKWESNWSRLPAGAATFCALRPTSPRNAGAISSIPTWTRTGPTATNPSQPRCYETFPPAVRSYFRWRWRLAHGPAGLPAEPPGPGHAVRL
jgi:hypothetical protein